MKISNINKLDAIIFDFDGVIFDTEPLWFKASIRTLKKLNFAINNNITFKQTIGIHQDKVFEILLNEKLSNLKIKKINNAFKVELDKVFKKKLKPFDGLRLFINKSRAELIIVSNSNYNFINNLLKNANLKKYFKRKNIISCTKKINPKPNPDGYIHAIKKFNLKKNKLLVIEDSENGISAAKRAGIKNILRFTNNHLNLSNKIKHKNIKNIKSYREFLK